jgi:hypothetical protein
MLRHVLIGGLLRPMSQKRDRGTRFVGCLLVFEFAAVVMEVDAEFLRVRVLVFFTG